MLHGKNVVVVLPAYKAHATLEKTYAEIPREIVDRVLLVDDASDDRTVELARKLAIETFVHERNLGYGANQSAASSYAIGGTQSRVTTTPIDLHDHEQVLHPKYSIDKFGHREKLDPKSFM